MNLGKTQSISIHDTGVPTTKIGNGLGMPFSAFSYCVRAL